MEPVKERFYGDICARGLRRKGRKGWKAAHVVLAVSELCQARSPLHLGDCCTDGGE